MSQFYTIQITGGTSPGPYSVFYNTIGTGNYATIYGTTNVASGITLASLLIGVNVEVPSPTTMIILYNELCNTRQVFEVQPPSEDYGCLCITINKGGREPSVVQQEVCYSGETINDKPVYENGLGVYVIWNNNGYWEMIGYTDDGGSTIFRSTDYDNIPDSGWYAVGEYSYLYTLTAQQGICGGIDIPIVLQIQTSDPTCEGVNDGSIIASATGGVPPFTYSLDGISFLNNTGIFTTLTPGPYTVYAKDSIGTIVSDNLVLNTPGITTYTIPAVVMPSELTGQIVGNMQYYVMQAIYDTSTIPIGISPVVRITVIYSKRYIEPGSVLFDTSQLQILKNGTPIPYSLSSSTPMDIESPALCDPQLNNYLGSDTYVTSDFVIENGDTLVVDGIYGIDVDTNGSIYQSCITRGYVSMVYDIRPTDNNCECCMLLLSIVSRQGVVVVYNLT